MKTRFNVGQLDSSLEIFNQNQAKKTLTNHVMEIDDDSNSNLDVHLQIRLDGQLNAASQNSLFMY